MYTLRRRSLPPLLIICLPLPSDVVKHQMSLDDMHTVSFSFLPALTREVVEITLTFIRHTYSMDCSAAPLVCLFARHYLRMSSRFPAYIKAFDFPAVILYGVRLLNQPLW